MLLQQAYMNCKRCYALANHKHMEFEGQSDKDIERIYICDDQMHEARNKTLEVLNDALMEEDIDSELAKEIKEIAAKCADCNFKKAYVADWAKPIYEKELEQE